MYHSREPAESPNTEGATAPTSESPSRYVGESAHCVPGATAAGQGNEDGQVLAHCTSGTPTG